MLQVLLCTQLLICLQNQKRNVLTTQSNQSAMYDIGLLIWEKKSHCFSALLQWEDFFDLIQPVAARVPYMVCIGNHERDWPNSG